ncbi:ATP-dependent Clp protease ATP-binding subunit [Glutamicibacter arilaitensis]|uniref:AAA family ATPase n=1 Tax=Glutamicibacter arilaitensis TaxID=256701 RepID=A0A2N7S012_9MICC|nr:MULTISPECIES: ATP-dependent Clp protease ATP-binding subunit [Glutamicibacter]PMQ19484.1 AAA family ATPase [Glutamicibacter arilaitensis]HCJ53894.1 ATP-dependent Clp protease ATP-binding subunit [Glutamicibacter sp.]HCM94589.1 ATP-dependent Clp protease ATP-binding subunit [Glutamicibacter sp.]
MPAFFGAPSDGSFEEFLSRFLSARAQAARPIDITRLLSARTHEAVATAAAISHEHGHDEIDSLHLLMALLRTEPIGEHLGAMGVDIDALGADAIARMPKSQEKAEKPTRLSSSAQRSLFDAYQVARNYGSTYIDPDHLFLAFVFNPESPVSQLLAQHGITGQSLQQAAMEQAQRAQNGGQEQGSEESDVSMLERYGTDLTALAADGQIDPVIGRDDELDQVVEILARRTKNNPVLIGEAGVGKTAIAEGLARAIVDDQVPEQIRGSRLISIDLPGMLAGTRYRGDFEQRLTGLLEEIADAEGQVLVFIDEMHLLVGAGSGESGNMDAANILKPRLARGELHLIGATTLDEFRKVEKDSALARRFGKVTVAEPSEEVSLAILEGLRESYEDHHQVQYTPAALKAAVALSARYLTDRQLPDKAIDLIDIAGARRSIAAGDTEDVQSLRAELVDAEREKSRAIGEERYEDASAWRDHITELTARITAAEEAGDAGITRVVDEAQISEVISRSTGIPTSRITGDDKTRLASLEESLHTSVIGQKDAVSAVARAVRRNRTGMSPTGRPIGSFLFLGPTGVGKTELAKALATNLFGSADSLVRVDMSEYGEKHTVARLIGAPPGYIGHDEPGQLTEKVRRNPYSVILLDEIEKAHPDVFNVLLQVLDDGRLTDSAGRTVDFSNTLILMTSNLGGEYLANKAGNFGFTSTNATSEAHEVRAKVMGKVREFMRPEFLNRLDEVLLFSKLSQSEISQIVKLVIAETEARLNDQELQLEISDAAVQFLASEGYDPEFGARPLRRLVQRKVQDAIADLLIDDSLAAGDTVLVDYAANKLSVQKKAEMPTPPAHSEQVPSYFGN